MLVHWLKEELEDKWYLIGLDDIWGIDAWYSISNAFPEGKIGSKVVFILWIKEVAMPVDPYSSSTLQFKKLKDKQ